MRLSLGRTAVVGVLVALVVGLAATYLTSLRPVEAAAPAVYSGYKNSAMFNGQAPVGSLKVPAGNYQVIAKLALSPGCLESFGCPASYNYTCELSVGSGFDRSSVKVIGPNNPATRPVAEVTTTVASYVPANQPITLRCWDDKSTANVMVASFVKVNALRVDSLSVSKLP